MEVGSIRSRFAGGIQGRIWSVLGCTVCGQRGQQGRQSAGKLCSCPGTQQKDDADAGFTITAVWPVRAEQASDRLESFRVAVVFRKNNNEVATIRRSLAAMLSREMPEKLEQVLTADGAEYDRPVIALGVGLSIATRYKKVLNADGSAMKVQDALQLAAQEATKFFAAIEENSEEN